MTTVCFLDIDGVLIPISPMMMGGGDLDDDCLDYFKQLSDHTPLTIVLTSTWRNDERKKERLAEAFKRVGIPAVFAGTPNGVRNPSTVTYLANDKDEQMLVRDRVDEIHEWLADNGSKIKCSERWIAIDDMDLGVDTRMAGHFLLTSLEDGLQRADVTKGKEIIDDLLAKHPVTDDKATDNEAQKELNPPATAKGFEEGAKCEGVVKRYNSKRGFGFIQYRGADIFVHQTSIKTSGFRFLSIGTAVRFTLSYTGGHRQALDVQPKRVRGGGNGMYNFVPRYVDPVTQWYESLVPEGTGWRSGDGTVYYPQPYPYAPVVDPTMMAANLAHPTSGPASPHKQNDAER